ncbi:MAG: rRNA maturation RNase YbeY [Flavobacteriales bacterium Tduv]
MINYFYENVNFSLQNEIFFTRWICFVVRNEDHDLDEINYTFCDDEYLLKMNQIYLDHDMYTDVITFDNSMGGGIVGDIFVSIERVAENSVQLTQNFQTELKRVMIHGVLHLLGYKDKDENEVRVMRKKEDLYLNLLH